MTCTHTDRPNVMNLPSIGNPHCCRECWDAKPRFRGEYVDYTQDEKTMQLMRGHVEPRKIWK